MLNKLFKKGQGMPLNVIIIAAICLFVLVILILIFTGRINWFEKGLGGEAEQELRVMQASYGDCHPTTRSESFFLSGYKSVDADDEEGKASEIDEYKTVINTCNNRNQAECAFDDKCTWQ